MSPLCVCCVRYWMRYYCVWLVCSNPIPSIQSLAVMLLPSPHVYTKHFIVKFVCMSGFFPITLIPSIFSIYFTHFVNELFNFTALNLHEYLFSYLNFLILFFTSHSISTFFLYFPFYFMVVLVFHYLYLYFYGYGVSLFGLSKHHGTFVRTRVECEL